MNTLGRHVAMAIADVQVTGARGAVGGQGVDSLDADVARLCPALDATALESVSADRLPAKSPGHQTL